MEADPLNIEGAGGGEPKAPAEPVEAAEPAPEPVSVSVPILESETSPNPVTDSAAERRRSSRACTAAPTRWTEATPDSEVEDFSAGSDDDYRPSQAKRNSRSPRTPRAPKRRADHLEPAPPVSTPPSVPPTPSISSTSVAPLDSTAISFMPIKIKNVKAKTTLPQPGSSLPNLQRPPPPKKKPPVSLSQRQVHCEILRKHINGAKNLGTTLSAKSEEFIVKKINTNSINNVESLLTYTKKAFDLIDLAKESISSLENKLRGDINHFVTSNRLEKFVNNDPILTAKLYENGTSDVKAEDGNSDSDCEIVDCDQTFETPDVMTKVEPGIFNALKKIEKCGISWKNCSPKSNPNDYNIMISDVRSQSHKIWLNKDIVMKKIPATKKNNNSFFWMDGRLARPPDRNVARRALITYVNVTARLKSALKFGWLDLADRCLRRVSERFRRFSRDDKIYRIDSIRPADDCLCKRKDLRTTEDLERFSVDIPTVETLKKMCLERIETIVRPKRDEISNILPKSLFFSSLDVLRKSSNENNNRNYLVETDSTDSEHSIVGSKSIISNSPKPIKDNIDDELFDPDESSNSYSDDLIKNHPILSPHDANRFNCDSDLLAKAAMLDESSDSSDDEMTNCTIDKNKHENDRTSKNKYDPSEAINCDSDEKESIDCGTDENKCEDDESLDCSIIKSKLVKNSIDEKNVTKGRKNIRKIITDELLADSTKEALNEEKNRLKRLAEMEEVYKNSKNASKNLILDFNNGKSICVHSALTKLLKTHQIDGIKFMWNSCFESVETILTGSPGSGCILAHCMGLGKTLQVIALINAILTNDILPMRTVLICCPLSTVLNWVDEFNKWLGRINTMKKIPIYELSRFRKNRERGFLLEEWHRKGGVFILGYEMFRHLTSMTVNKFPVQQNFIDRITTILQNPGPDIVVCDEGHLLKNKNSYLSIAMNMIRTKRRIVLTGTPLQNNLREYYCMVNFVKPHLLGSEREYANRFEIPITNGQHRDSSQSDIKLMKKRSHVLHKMLEGSVQRKEASVLYEYLPAKEEYVLLIPLSDIQAEIYRMYLNLIRGKQSFNKSAMSLLKDFSILQKIWTHPRQLIQGYKNHKDSTMQNKYDWCYDLLSQEDLFDTLNISHKMIVAFNIIDECVRVGDKLIIFCTSLSNLDSFEYFLKKEKMWKQGYHYYRMDGSINMQNRRKLCANFNSPNNTLVKLFLVSTRVGNLGINMIGANRVIIMDVSWNPSHDLQSIFRIYRFGQKKISYIYRLVAYGTMEEKIYERSVTKQAVSCRVIDEQQIDRHYNMTELIELYNFVHLPDSPQPTPILPGDNVLAAVLLNLRNNERTIVWSVHQHDSLLRDIHEEQLDETERKTAWIEYETESIIQAKNIIPTPNKQAIPLGWYDKNHVPQKINNYSCIQIKTMNNPNNTLKTRSTNIGIKIHNSKLISNVENKMNIFSNKSVKHFKPFESPKKRYGNIKYPVIIKKCTINTPECTSNQENIAVNVSSKYNILPNGRVIYQSSRKVHKKSSSVKDTNEVSMILDLTNLPDTPEKKTPKRRRSSHYSPGRSKKTMPDKVTPSKRMRTSNTPFAKKLNFINESNNQPSTSKSITTNQKFDVETIELE